ncbi:hypothetical protein CULT_1880002 [[Clostridium] ultunense Esp]|nr:hypothetical protein CULT_1880002 [[Clostridium] ultunense Esp]
MMIRPLSTTTPHHPVKVTSELRVIPEEQRNPHSAVQQKIICALCNNYLLIF